MPRGFRIVAPVLGACVEELFFRGILLSFLLAEIPSRPHISEGGALAISVVGGVSVVAFDSIVPALIAHSTFVFFHLAPAHGSPRGNRKVTA